MKKFLLLSTSIFFLINCKTNQQKPEKISFKVNQGTEFLMTAFNLAVEKEMSDEYKPCETVYTKRIESHFKPFKNHPFLKYIFDNVNSGTDFASIGLLITDFETMELDPNIKPELIKRKIYTDNIDNFKKLASSFYKETDFKTFFQENQDYYKKATSNIQKQIHKDSLFQKIKNYYQDKRTDLEFIAFVELTNNNESQAVDFYDNYNPNIRAITLGNFCELSTKSTSENEILDLKNYQDILCHEISHLYTTSVFLNKYIGNLNEFRSLFDNKLNDSQLKDKIDHYIIYSLQGILTKRIYNDLKMDNIFKTKVKDVRKNIYLHLSKYNPKENIPFEKYYKESIELIRKEAKIKTTANKELRIKTTK